MRIAVVGAGILGLAVARELSASAEVTVLDKEDRIAAHQTSHNSGVVHAGVYYAPGSLKAQLCRRGMELLRDFCSEHELAYEECGKVIVARDAAELPRLDEIERRALANGLPGLRRLSAEEPREIEPHVVGLAGLHSPRTAIVDFGAVARELAEGADIRLGFEVVGVQRRGAEVALSSAAGQEIVA